ncbi:hypothetical protein LF1_27610 [Rubripirellula obstinata]|uniref:Uncharacterized protein n=1 Tax=Rubripirellula obstinata TaxID=406547 RepID=A0A5B1CIY8_9BACT|nr:hypothetical protein [Rubripirellula obstinata]KAA1260222.1 hypothetical protein LF1_27610 [Rubripirellula obstinata]
MISKLLTAFAAFCIGTVITQMILAGYMVGSGRVDTDTVTKVVALVNGIDISGKRLQQIMRQGEDREQPDFDEILEARKLDGFDLELRLQSQQAFRDELSTMLADLKIKTERFDARYAAFNGELEEMRKGVQEKGLQDVQRTIQSLDAVQAKDQLLIMYDDERIDDVVTIIQAMPTEKRKDILAEFTDAKESEKLAEILRRIADGQPTKSLIDQATEE